MKTKTKMKTMRKRKTKLRTLLIKSDLNFVTSPFVGVSELLISDIKTFIPPLLAHMGLRS